MSLEQVQGLVNKADVATETTAMLIDGARTAAAAEQLGLSAKDAMKLRSRARARQRRIVTEEDQVRTFMQKQGTTGEFSGDGELQGLRYEDEDEISRAFGEDQSDFQNFKADDRGFTADEETGLIRRETFDETRGEAVDIAPQSALRDALANLNREEKARMGLQGRLAGVFGGGNQVDTEIDTAKMALQQHLQSEAPSDARVGRALVRQDNQRFDPEVREANDFRADAEAQAIARDGYTVNGPGAMADEAIGRIAEIRSLGKIGETAHIIRTADDAIQGQVTRRHDGVYLDPRTNDPVAIQGPELPPALAGDRRPNTGNSDNNLNAPTTAREWVRSAVPDYRDSGGRSFGDFPQVDITRETTNFANRVRDLGQRLEIGSLANVSANIRNVEELDTVARIVQAEKEKRGKSLMVRDPETGKNTNAGQNLVGGLMNELRMSMRRRKACKCHVQLDAAKRSSVNQNPTGTYLSRQTLQGPRPAGQGDIVFDAPEAVGGADTALRNKRKVQRSKVRILFPLWLDQARTLKTVYRTSCWRKTTH